MKQRNCRLLFVLISSSICCFAQAAPRLSKGQVEIYVTTQDKKQDLRKIQINKTVREAVSSTITLDPQIRFTKNGRLRCCCDRIHLL